MSKGTFELSLGPCWPGYDRGPPRTFRLGLLSAAYQPGGLEEIVQRRVDAGMLLREAAIGRVLADAHETFHQLSRQLPGAANAAGQRDSAPGGVVPSHAAPPDKLDAAAGGVPHFRGKR